MVAISTIARPAGPADARALAAADARLRLLIAGGGDDRIWLDPITRRNRYGVPATPAPDELWFSSSTASAVSPRGWAAARDALDRITAPGRDTIAGLFETLRQRLLSLYGPPGAEAVFAASGTEAELVTLSLALALAGGPVANIVIAPAETGSGVPAAAAGAHFLSHASLGGAVVKGARLAGWEDAEISLGAVEIRSPCGALRPQADVDHDAALKVGRAVAAGTFALLHVLDASKTGRAGVSRAAAAAILARHPDRVLVVVDACQLRCAAADVRRDLEQGFAVMITGSKFAGGPAFCGALLLPAALAERLAAAVPAGAALAPYSAVLDWPAPLRRPFAAGLASAANLGLGLRWSAALAEIEAYEALPADRRIAVLDAFDRAVRARIDADPGLLLADRSAHAAAVGLIAILHADRGDPRAVYEALAIGAGGARRCHLGQPVAVGETTALRVCASMPMITDTAQRGFAALEADLDQVFRSWAGLRA